MSWLNMHFASGGSSFIEQHKWKFTKQPGGARAEPPLWARSVLSAFRTGSRPGARAYVTIKSSLFPLPALPPTLLASVYAPEKGIRQELDQTLSQSPLNSELL